ncbi:MAG: AAA family ATPase [Oscillospiraceae bacterium]|nr:AAA family ATPase [Oscillospiraceae bacterium]
MTKKTLITSGKGGVGKSTITVLLGFFLTILGKKVIILDLDFGISSVEEFLKELEPVFNLGDILTGACSVEAAVNSSRYKKLDFIAAAKNYTMNIQSSQLQQIIKSLEGYDFILLDSPAGLNLDECINDEIIDDALIVANPEKLCLTGARNVSRLLEERGILERRLIINKFNSKTWKKSNLESLDMVIDFVTARLIAIIPFMEKLEVVSHDFEGLVSYKKFYKALLNLANRYLGTDVKLLFK